MESMSAICRERIGRDAEIETLQRNSILGRTTFISGSAGVGKSSMSSEALAIAAETFRTPLIGHCTIGQAIAFEPFAAAIRRRTRTMSDPEVASLFSGNASLSAVLVPNGAQLNGGVLETPPQDDLFAAIWQLLHRLAGSSGAVLLLEDLHWADADTLRLLTYLVRESDDLGVWIVGTYRGDEVHRRHPLAPVLAELARERKYDELTLNPLSRNDSGKMIESIFSGLTPSAELVDALFERTHGNPFFTEELLKVLLERGDLEEDSGVVRQRRHGIIEMPTTVRETLLSRVRSLTTDSSTLLHLAALAGDRLSPEVLAVATGLAMTVIDATISEALNLQLLEEHHDASGPFYIFRHALTREALSDELVGPERRQGHLRLAAGVLEVHRDELGTYAAELAEHYLHGGDRVKAIEWGRRAARRAVESFAIDETSRLYEQVLALMAPDDPERLEVLMEAVSGTIDSVGRVSSSSALKIGLAFASEARRLAQQLADPVAEARAIEAISIAAVTDGNTSLSVELLREALELVHGRDDFFEAWVEARLCGDLTRIDEVDEALSRLPEAMGLAQRSKNHLAVSRLHVVLMMNESFREFFYHSLDAARSEAKLAQSARAEHSLEQTAGFISLWCGDLITSRRCFERSLAIGEQLSPHDSYTTAGYVWLLAVMGRFDDALAAIERTREDNKLGTQIVALTGIYEIAERRDSPDLDQICADLWQASLRSGESQRSVPALAARARWRLIQEGLDAASADFWHLLEVTVSARGRGSHWLFSPDFAIALLDHERPEELSRWAHAISQVTASDQHPHNLAADALVRGCRDLAADNHESAAAALTMALDIYGHMDCPARVVETHLVLSSLALRMGEYDKALIAAATAEELAEGIGASALIERAQRRKEAAAGESIVATILFTDIVNSTQRAHDIGDSGWRTLLDRHDAIVRRELVRFRGREVNTTGDGFVASFDSASQAVRCARGVQEGLGALHVEVRAGIHTGECQVVGNDLRGVAVHLAARVCSSAQPGEIRVTSTVKDLLSGHGVVFKDIGAVELKGFSETWRLYAL
jgi:class 3 adenylate cyclase